jgi:hypothetical protein
MLSSRMFKDSKHEKQSRMDFATTPLSLACGKLYMQLFQYRVNYSEINIGACRVLLLSLVVLACCSHVWLLLRCLTPRRAHMLTCPRYLSHLSLSGDNGCPSYSNLNADAGHSDFLATHPDCKCLVVCLPH